MIANKSSRAACRHSRTGSDTALLINQGLCFVHDLAMLDRRTGIRDGLLDLSPKPGVVGVRSERETGGERPLPCDAGKKDSDSIRDRQAHTREPFRRFGLQAVVDTDVEHRGARGHGSQSLSGTQYVSQLRGAEVALD